MHITKQIIFTNTNKCLQSFEILDHLNFFFYETFSFLAQAEQCLLSVVYLEKNNTMYCLRLSPVKYGKTYWRSVVNFTSYKNFTSEKQRGKFKVPSLNGQI